MALRDTIFFIIFLIASLISLLTPFASSQNANVLAIFAFGDSTIDPGNNNHIKTLFRSDHLPYGIDFPDRIPTGRFCDGKLVTDFLISSLGIKELLPAYLNDSVTNTDLLSSVSFALASSGLDPQTVVIIQVLDLPTQLNNFYEALQRMEGVVRRKENPYKTRARRIAVAGLPPIGCVPAQVTIGSVLPISTNFLQRSCVDNQNIDSQAYNQQLEALTSSWQSKLRGSRIVYADIYSPIMENNYGFKVTLEACCGTGLAEAVGPLCNQLAPNMPRCIIFSLIQYILVSYRSSISGYCRYNQK